MGIYKMDFKLGKMVEISVPENANKNNLPIGTVLTFIGYGDHDLVITANRGISENWPQSGANYEYVDLVDYRKGVTQAYGLRHISEKYGIGIYITDKPLMSAAEVQSAVNNAETKIKFKEEEKIRNEERSKNTIERIKKENPHLVQGKNQVVAAKNIRIELKKAFPSVKFSVRSSTYSGGDSVDIGWTDGPTTEMVKKITDKYQEGSFDGMTDSYDYSKHREWTDTFGGSKYVMENRSISPETFQKVADELNYGPAVWNENQGEFSGVDYETSQSIKREVYRRGF